MDLDDEITKALAGRYDIERRLGQGGMATVFLALDVRHRRHVAVKVLRPELTSVIGATRFLREIAIVAPLMHPNILALHDSGEADGFLYFVMPYVEGPTLRERLKREVQLPIDEAVSIARQVASALDYAHAHDVIHRDIKPDNILLLGDHVLVADFGLAKALSFATPHSLTESGIVVGTPFYMSPEQCNAGRVLDARSDIYSLACTVFEMIAGVPPFRGATPQSTISHHLTSKPPSLLSERKSCPPGIDEAVQRALAKVPADRFRTAGEFVQALAPHVSVSAAPTSTRAPSRLFRGRTLAAAGLVMAGIATSAWLASGRPGFLRAQPPAGDTTHIALLPLERGEGGAGVEDELLYEALARWQDITIIDQFRVLDAIHQRGNVASDDSARHVATTLGAARYIRGRVLAIGDSVAIRAGLYDVSKSEALFAASVRVPRQGSVDAIGHALQRLADTLLLRGRADAGPAQLRGPRSLKALQFFAAGQRALASWDLPAAEAAYESALAAQPGFTRASLWMRQVQAWQTQNAKWRAIPHSEGDAEEELGRHDAALLRALNALAEERFSDACAIYDSVRAGNDRDFTAWYGLGKCRTLDRVVVADSSSPSGYRFRSNYGRALAAYERAFVLLPSAQQGLQSDAFEALRNLLFIPRDRLVSGHASGDARAGFLGRIALLGDSIAVIPYPWSVVTSGANTTPPGFEAALARQRAAFARIAAGWTSALPRSSQAKEALAVSLEMAGDPSAADTLRAARRLTPDPERQLQLAASEVLVRVKFALPGNAAALRDARTLADSIVSVASEVSTATAAYLLPVAELLGRCDRAVSFGREMHAGPLVRPVAVPQLEYSEYAEVLERAALACPRPGDPTPLTKLYARIQHSPAIADSVRAQVQQLLLVLPIQLSFPGEPSVARQMSQATPLLSAMAAFHSGDHRAAREMLARIDSGRSIAPQIEAAFPEARLWLALGDSLKALTTLRGALAAVPTYEPRTLTARGRAATLVRAMGLCAELERRKGDSRSGETWYVATQQLRSDGGTLDHFVRSIRSHLGI
jgi:tetratricopeptide (TPR) repeat protein